MCRGERHARRPDAGGTTSTGFVGASSLAAFLIGLVPACGPRVPPAIPPPPGSLTTRALALFAAEDRSFDAGETAASLESLAAEARTRLEGIREPERRVEALNRFFFQERGFSPDADLEDPHNLFPDRVLHRRRGYCTGLALIYASVAERLDLPVFGVNTPQHLLLRYDDGTARINIELLAGGRNVADEVYRSRDAIEDSSVDRGVFLTNLDEDRFLSHLANNLGTLHTRAGRARRADELYEMAVRLDPLNPTAHYNIARQRMIEGRLPEAIVGFSTALELHPNHVPSLNHRGVCRARTGDPDGAVADFLAALSIDPASESVRKNLEKFAGPGS